MISSWKAKDLKSVTLFRLTTWKESYVKWAYGEFRWGHQTVTPWAELKRSGSWGGYIADAIKAFLFYFRALVNKTVLHRFFSFRIISHVRGWVIFPSSIEYLCSAILRSVRRLAKIMFWYLELMSGKKIVLFSLLYPMTTTCWGSPESPKHEE